MALMKFTVMMLSRLLELALVDEDIQARWKLQWLFKDKNEMEFLKEILENPGAIEKIKTLIWDRKIILDT